MIAKILMVMILSNGHVHIIGTFNTQESCLSMRAQIVKQTPWKVGCINPEDWNADYGGYSDEKER